MSDTHNQISESNVDQVPSGDVFLHAGDFTLDGYGMKEYRDFNKILGKYFTRLFEKS